MVWGDINFSGIIFSINSKKNIFFSQWNLTPSSNGLSFAFLKCEFGSCKDESSTNPISVSFISWLYICGDNKDPFYWDEAWTYLSSNQKEPCPPSMDFFEHIIFIDRCALILRGCWFEKLFHQPQSFCQRPRKGRVHVFYSQFLLFYLLCGCVMILHTD